MTIDHDRFAEANQPPPERVTETPEVEASPEEGKPPIDAVANVEGVEVACRLEEGTMHVTVQLPGRIESISTSVRVRCSGLFFDVAPAPDGGGDSYSNELPPRPSA